MSAFAPDTSGAVLIAAERKRQVTEELHRAEHDDRHADGSLALAACTYAMLPHCRKYKREHEPVAISPVIPTTWPWSSDDWRPTPDDRVRELVKAGALIAAEIDRLLRGGGRG